MNIIAQSCGVVLLCILLYFYCKHKRLKLYTETSFLRLLYVSLLTLVLDIASIVGIVYAASMPDWGWQVICKAYLISLILTIYTGHMYVCTDLYKEKKLYKKTVRFVTALFLIGAVLIVVFPISYQYDGEREIYTEGPSVLTTYATAILLILAIIYQIRYHGKMLNPRRKHAITVWVCLWLIAATIQFLNNQLLIVGFAIALGSMILYLALENPESNIDRESGLFNQNGLVLYMRQMYERNLTFSMLAITFRYAESSKTTSEISEKDKQEILAFFRSMKNVYIFTTIENEVILIYADRDKMEAGIQEVQERFGGCLCGLQTTDDCRRLELRYVIAEDSSIAKNEDMLLIYFDY